ncbi:MAG: N-acetylneuraminate synthase [Acidimicrobiales bacterium]|nr:N-acetylneuraminate synthase [Acidimicrobiales bacterium]
MTASSTSSATSGCLPGTGVPAPHLIAEIGSVHDGSFGNALQLIDAAAAAGADAVKFQTHLASAETRADAPSPGYFSAEPRHAYFTRTGFTPGQWSELRARAEAAGVVFISSAFSLEAVDLLEEIGVAAHKVPSGEVTNIPLLERLAETGKPVYLSSGMSTWAELDAAVEALRPGGRIVVMQCASIYPCPPEQVGLNVLAEMRERYGLPVGYSDHSLGMAAAVAAVVLGAEVIEKHFTFSTLMYGSDAQHSMEPPAFAQLASMLAETRAMVAASVDKDAAAAALGDMKHIFEKSIVASRPLGAGTVLGFGELAFKKPGDGIPASRYREIVGRTINRDLPLDHQFSEEDLT